MLFFFCMFSNLMEILCTIGYGAGTAYPSGAPEFTPGFQSGSCYSIFSFLCSVLQIVVVFLYFFFWLLRCLSFIDLWILITTLVTSNSSFYASFNICQSTTLHISIHGRQLYPKFICRLLPNTRNGSQHFVQLVWNTRSSIN